MSVQVENGPIPVAEAAVLIARQRDKHLIFPSDAEGLAEKVASRMMQALLGKPQVIVRKGSEEDRIPPGLQGKQTEEAVWVFDRLAPRLGPVRRVLYSLPLSISPGERASRKIAAALNREAKRHPKAFDVYNKNGIVEPKRGRS